MTDLVNAVIADVEAAVKSVTPSEVLDLAKRLAENFAINEAMKAQDALDTLEEQSGSLFKAGWRPYIGWGLGTACIIMLGVMPIIAWSLRVYAGWPHVPDAPQFNMIGMEILTSMLAINIGARTVEKVYGILNK